MDSIIDVRNLSFKYDEKTVLDNISIDIKPGTLVSIIGPNGSGKTTLLKCISGILLAEHGSVRFKGIDVYRYKKRELAKLMAYVPQNTSVDFGFSVLDIVLMGRAPYLRPFQSETHSDMEIADRSMQMTNIIDIKDKKVTEISGGERQRVIIARALAQTPDIILLDEPVSSLDIQHQMDVMALLRELSRSSGITVMAVLHDLNLASEYSDDVMLMKGGRLLKYGTPSEVITSDNIKAAYNTDIYMTKNPVTGNPHIIPIKKS